MELTNEQKVKLFDAIGIETLFRHLPQREIVHALSLYSFTAVEKKVGCTNGWMSHRMSLGQIPEPSQKILRRWYFTQEEVKQIEKVWKKRSSDSEQKMV